MSRKELCEKAMSRKELCEKAENLLRFGGGKEDFERLLKEGYSPWMHDLCRDRATQDRPKSSAWEAFVVCDKEDTASAFLAVFPDWAERLLMRISAKDLECPIEKTSTESFRAWIKINGNAERLAVMSERVITMTLAPPRKSRLKEDDVPFFGEWLSMSSRFWMELGARTALAGVLNEGDPLLTRRWTEHAMARMEEAEATQGQRRVMAFVCAAAGWLDLAERAADRSEWANDAWKEFSEGDEANARKMSRSAKEARNFALRLMDEGVRVSFGERWEKSVSGAFAIWNKEIPLMALLSKGILTGDFGNPPKGVVFRKQITMRGEPPLRLREMKGKRYCGGISKALRRAEKGACFQWTERALVSPLALMWGEGGDLKNMAHVLKSNEADVSSALNRREIFGVPPTKEERAEAEALILEMSSKSGLSLQKRSRI